MMTPGVEYSKQKPCSPFSTSSPLSSLVSFVLSSLVFFVLSSLVSLVLSSLVSFVLSSLVSFVLSSLVSFVLSSFVSLRSSFVSPVLRRTELGSRSLSAFLQLATESDQTALNQYILVRFRIRILLFSSVTFKTPTNYYFLQVFFLFFTF
jgi:hypothetical protein